MFESRRRHQFFPMKPAPDLRTAPLWWLYVPLFAALMALGAQVDVPMAPVPMSLQSLAVVLAGALLGPWRGMAGALLYLAAGAAGLPVFAGAAGGIEHLSGATGGYLAAFPLAAGLVGLAATQGWTRRPGGGFPVMLAGHAVILGLGAGWLAMRIGLGAAVSGGLTPFLFGAAVKSAVAALIVWLAERRRAA